MLFRSTSLGTGSGDCLHSRCAPPSRHLRVRPCRHAYRHAPMHELTRVVSMACARRLVGSPRLTGPTPHPRVGASVCSSLRNQDLADTEAYLAMSLIINSIYVADWCPLGLRNSTLDYWVGFRGGWRFKVGKARCNQMAFFGRGLTPCCAFSLRFPECRIVG